MSSGVSPGLPAGLPAGSFVGTSATTHKSNSSWQTTRPTAPGTSWPPQAKPAPRASEQLRSHFSVIGAREERGVRAPSFGKSCIYMLVGSRAPCSLLRADQDSCIYGAHRGYPKVADLDLYAGVLGHLCRPGPSHLPIPNGF